MMAEHITIHKDWRVTVQSWPEGWKPSLSGVSWKDYFIHWNRLVIDDANSAVGGSIKAYPQVKPEPAADLSYEEYRERVAREREERRRRFTGAD